MDKLEKRLTLLSILFASTTMLVGIVALIGWLSEIPLLVQLTPQAYIQANTALSFILSGLALLMIIRSQFRVVWLVSIPILVMGGLTLFQYLFQSNLGVDEFLFKDFIFTGASHPNRMAPNTALCFTLFAITLLHASNSLNTGFENLATAALGSLIFVLASIALSGFLVGLEEAFGWGHMTRMSPQTAITFMIASSAIICLAIQRELLLERGFPSWSASLASLMVITLFIGIWQLMVTEERQLVKSDVRLKHDALVAKLVLELRNRSDSLQRMGRRFEVDYMEEEYRAEWEHDSKNYVKHYSDYMSLDWIDSDYRVQWSVTPNGIEDPGGLSLKNSKQYQTLNSSRETREVRASSVFHTLQGEKTISIFVPLFEKDKFLGFIRSRFSVHQFMGNIFGKEKNRIETSININGTSLYVSETDDVGDYEQWLTLSEVSFNSMNWEIQCVPGQSYLAEMKSVKPEVVMVFGFILAWALGASIRSSQKARKNEMELVGSNDELKKQAEILEQINDAVISIDTSLNIVRWNRGAERIFHYPENEILNQPLSVLFPMEGNLLRQIVTVPAQIKGSHELETCAVRKDGEKIFVHLSMTSLCDERCVPHTIVCLALDISDRKNFEKEKLEKDKELEKAHRKNQLILDAVGEGIYGIDMEGNTTFVNPSAAKMLGYSPQELVGKSQHLLIHHSRQDGSEYPIEQCPIYMSLKDGKNHHESDEVFWKKDGRFFPVEYVSMPIYEDEKICGAVVTFKDVTEKKQARKRLEAYSQNLEKMVEKRTEELNGSLADIRSGKNQIEGILKSIGEGLLVTDQNGKIVLMNPAAESILGIKKENVLSKYVNEVLNNLSHSSNWDTSFKDMSSYGCFGIELGGNGSGLDKKYIRGASTSLLGSDNEIIGTVVAIRDISYERKVDHLKSQFFSTAAHELRTPLTSLQGFSEILLTKRGLDKYTEKKYLRYINEESLKLAKIINDFLDISRIESGKGVLVNKNLCSVRGTIERSMHIFDEQINTDHNFEFRYFSENIFWNVDQDKMEQVLKNIYSNAIKYSPKGGTITTEVKATNDSVEIVVEDEGVGMSPDQLDHIFDRFYRGNNFAPEIPGSGLGMTIVKYILEAHEAKISVSSEPGIGARVLITVPFGFLEKDGLLKIGSSAE